PLGFIIALYADLFVLVCLLGTGMNIQLYFLVVVALTVLFIGAEHIVLAAILGAAAAAQVIALQFLAPSDTGLTPPTMVFASFVINAVVSCGVLLLIVSYALREVARAEAVAEREYERSERLLANILPTSVAARLKSGSQAVIADKYGEASILFADMAG